MSLTMRKMFLCLIGLLAGLAAWPAAELAINLQADFDSYLLFSVFLGLVFGLIMGGFLGSGEGITLKIRFRIFTGILTGALVGMAGGALGFLGGQGLLFLLGDTLVGSEHFHTLGFPLARAGGWALLGLFLGSVEGIRARSRLKLKTGLLGGLAGGFLGGLALEYMRLLVADIMLARLLGLLLFGLCLGLFYSLIEAKLSAGVLRLLNGPRKGREYVLNQRHLRIGAAPRSDIRLDDYLNVLDEHVTLTIREAKEGYEPALESVNPAMPVAVNEKKTSAAVLGLNDVIQIGTAKFMYRQT